MIELIFIPVLGFLMGVITAISGGAGVFAVPTMLAFGFSPVNTLALNRTSDLGVVLGALRNYKNSNTIDWKLGIIAAFPLCIGAYLGANVSLSLPEATLQKVIYPSLNSF